MLRLDKCITRDILTEHGYANPVSSQGHPSQIRRYRALHPGQLSARSSRGLVLAPDQLSVGSSRGHPSQIRRYRALHHGQLSAVSSRGHPSQSRSPGGIEPSTLVNSPPGQVGAAPFPPINTPSGYREVASSVSSHVPASVSSSVAPVSSLTSPMSVLVPITDPPLPVTHHLCPLSPDPPSTALNTTQATSHEQPVDLPVESDRPQSAFLEEVEDEDLLVPSTGPQPIGDTTVQHINDSDIFDGPGLTSSSAPPPIEDPPEDLGTSDSDNDSLPSLGDPEPEFFGETTLPSISLIRVAAFKRLIDAGEEVYTINIQPTSDYLDIMAL